MHVRLVRFPAPVARLGWALGTLAAIAAAVALARDGAVAWWVYPLFLLGPDLAFLAGIGDTRGLERGQMPPRAVPYYNALHRLEGPAAFAVVAAVALPHLFLVGAVLWAVQVGADRALGYGPRTADGRRG